MSLPIKDHIFVQTRKGTVDDPYISINESVTIVNNTAILKEIPDEFTKVTISGFTETKGVIDDETKFKCDYQRGILTFHPSQEGNLIPVSFRGKGIVKYYADRILAQNHNTNVYENLQEIIDSGLSATEVLGEVQSAVNNAELATANANSFKWMGTWNSATTYKKNEIIQYLNSSYISLIDNNTNNAPDTVGSTKWTLIAQKGTMTDSVVDNSLTIRKSDGSVACKIQVGPSTGLEFVFGG